MHIPPNLIIEPYIQINIIHRIRNKSIVFYFIYILLESVDRSEKIEIYVYETVWPTACETFEVRLKVAATSCLNFKLLMRHRSCSTVF